MKRLKYVLATGVLWCIGFAVVHAQPAAPQAPPSITVIHAGTLIARPPEAPQTSRTIVVRGDRVLRIAEEFLDPAAIPEAELAAVTVVDLKDHWVPPGLLDGHVHLGFQSGGSPLIGYTQSDSEMALASMIFARRTLAAGFTTVRDLASGAETIHLDRDRPVSVGLLQGDAYQPVWDAQPALGPQARKAGLREVASVLPSCSAGRNQRKALKPGGRVAFACWRDWRENEWVRVSIAAVRPHVPPPPKSGPEDPGPFSFADPGRVRRILANAGFDAITMKPFDTPIELGGSPDAAADYLQEFGPISRMLTDASPRRTPPAA